MTGPSVGKATMYKLIGGSSIENDSDQVILIDHTGKVQQPGGLKTAVPCIIDKNRHGRGQFSFPTMWKWRTFNVSEPAAATVGNAARKG